MSGSVSVRCYEELNDFLCPERRKRDFTLSMKDGITVLQILEYLAIPPNEVDLILVNGKSVPFSCKVQNGDRVSLYPIFESFNISKVTQLRKKPLRKPKFILDTDLKRLSENRTGII